MPNLRRLEPIPGCPVPCIPDNEGGALGVGCVADCCCSKKCDNICNPFDGMCYSLCSAGPPPGPTNVTAPPVPTNVTPSSVPDYCPSDCCLTVGQSTGNTCYPECCCSQQCGLVFTDVTGQVALCSGVDPPGAADCTVTPENAAASAYVAPVPAKASKKASTAKTSKKTSKRMLRHV